MPVFHLPSPIEWRRRDAGGGFGGPLEPPFVAACARAIERVCPTEDGYAVRVDFEQITAFTDWKIQIRRGLVRGCNVTFAVLNNASGNVSLRVRRAADLFPIVEQSFASVLRTSVAAGSLACVVWLAGTHRPLLGLLAALIACVVYGIARILVLPWLIWRHIRQRARAAGDPLDPDWVKMIKDMAVDALIAEGATPIPRP